jgi:hypothetical protein
MKYLSANNDLILIKHGNGLLIDSYSLQTIELIKHREKDFYPDNGHSIDIHRIEFYSNYYFAMNVEVNDEEDILDLFFFSNIQPMRQMENVYLILYLPFNYSWSIRQRNDHQQMDLCL